MLGKREHSAPTDAPTRAGLVHCPVTSGGPLVAEPALTSRCQRCFAAAACADHGLLPERGHEGGDDSGRWVLACDRWHTGLCATRRCLFRLEVKDPMTKSS